MVEENTAKKVKREREKPYVDPARGWSNARQWRISFKPMQATVTPVYFDAFIENFSDNWSCNWNPESVFGRMDPIYTFQNTQRRMQLSFAVPANSVEQGSANLRKFERLVSFLYPAYETRDNNQRTMSAPPILLLKFGNLIQDTSTGAGDITGENAISANAKDGLLVAVNGFSMNPNLELGFFNPVAGQFIPKAFTVDVDMGIIHRHMLGWEGDKFSRGNYPYNTDPNAQSTDLRDNDPVENAKRLDRQTALTPAERAASLTDEEKALLTDIELQNMGRTATQEQIAQERAALALMSDPDAMAEAAVFGTEPLPIGASGLATEQGEHIAVTGDIDFVGPPFVED